MWTPLPITTVTDPVKFWGFYLSIGIDSVNCLLVSGCGEVVGEGSISLQISPPPPPLSVQSLEICPLSWLIFFLQDTVENENDEKKLSAVSLVLEV